jgi:dihydrofolate reductase
VKPFQAIAAMSLNRVIGRAGAIPWHLPEDFKWFKKVTTGHILLMGRKTFESIGRPLPGRETIVLTRGPWQWPGVRACPGFESLDLGEDPRQVFVCGGAQVYAQALPLCSDLFLTVVQRVLEGDAFFPPFEEQFEFVTALATWPEFTIRHYRRKPGFDFQSGDVRV